nr:CNNM domain-containing protein [Actinomycetota bacterium]
MGTVWTIVLIALLLAIAAFCAMAETAITRFGKVKALHLAQESTRKSAATLLKIVEDPAPFLNVVLLVTLLAHITGTTLATGLALRTMGDGAEAVAVGAMTFLIFVLAEVVPKTFTVQRTETAALVAAPVVYHVGRLLMPVARLLILVANGVMVLLPGRALPKGPFVTEDEIRHMVDVAEEEEEIEEEERELIHSVFEFGDTVVREVMVPRPDMVTIPATSTLDEGLDTIIKGGYSRVPIYEGDTDNIIGVLYAKDLLKRIHEGKREAKVAALGRAPLFVPEQKK